MSEEITREMVDAWRIAFHEAYDKGDGLGSYNDHIAIGLRAAIAAMNKRRNQDFVTWLHARADCMNDPHARGILNSAADDFGKLNKQSFATTLGQRLHPANS